jgi:hypothetical protein
VSRRVTLPGADELFRATAASARPEEPAPAEVPRLAPVRSTSAISARPAGARRPTGRTRHDEKITVYVSPEELLELEHARLTLRGAHGLAVDRGRIVREAMAVVLADLEAKGADSIIVRRLRDA